jgi:hypothetical protein
LLGKDPLELAAELDVFEGAEVEEECGFDVFADMLEEAEVGGVFAAGTPPFATFRAAMHEEHEESANTDAPATASMTVCSIFCNTREDLRFV